MTAPLYFRDLRHRQSVFAVIPGPCPEQDRAFGYEPATGTWAELSVERASDFRRRWMSDPFIDPAHPITPLPRSLTRTA